MCSRQSSRVLPNTATLSPRPRRCAAAESPYGPAPTTTASYGASGTNRRGVVVSPSTSMGTPPERGQLSLQNSTQREAEEPRGRPQGGTGISPLEVVVAHRAHECGEEVERGPTRRRDPGPAPLSDRVDRPADVAAEVPHPAARSVALDPVDRHATRPLPKQEGEVDARPDRDFDGCREAWIDLHQHRSAGAVPTEFDLGVAFAVDLADEPFGLVPDVLRHRDALTQDGIPAERRDRPLGPLREPRIELTV